MGEGPRVMAEVDRIKLVQPDLKNMTKGLDGSIHTKDGQPAQADAGVKLTSGFLQASNVNAVEEMTAVLALSKQFELHIKMMNSAKEDDQAMTRVPGAASMPRKQIDDYTKFVGIYGAKKPFLPVQ